MKKNYVIITEELRREPGIYGIKIRPETEIQTDIKIELDSLSNLDNWKNIKDTKEILGKSLFKVADSGIGFGKKILKDNFSKDRFYLDKINFLNCNNKLN